MELCTVSVGLRDSKGHLKVFVDVPFEPATAPNPSLPTTGSDSQYQQITVLSESLLGQLLDLTGEQRVGRLQALFEGPTVLMLDRHGARFDPQVVRAVTGEGALQASLFLSGRPLWPFVAEVDLEVLQRWIRLGQPFVSDTSIDEWLGSVFEMIYGHVLLNPSLSRDWETDRWMTRAVFHLGATSSFVKRQRPSWMVGANEELKADLRAALSRTARETDTWFTMLCASTAAGFEQLLSQMPLRFPEPYMQTIDIITRYLALITSAGELNEKGTITIRFRTETMERIAQGLQAVRSVVERP